MKPFEALIDAGALTLWLPPMNRDNPQTDSVFMAEVRQRRNSLMAFADGTGKEPDADWSIEKALLLRVPSDPTEPRTPPSAADAMGITE